MPRTPVYRVHAIVEAGAFSVRMDRIRVMCRCVLARSARPTGRTGPDLPITRRSRAGGRIAPRPNRLVGYP